jgi:hypothetical protein
LLDKDDTTFDNDDDASTPSATDATAGLVDMFRSMVIYWKTKQYAFVKFGYGFNDDE